MSKIENERRDFLMSAGLGSLGAMALMSAPTDVKAEVLAPTAFEKPKHQVRFGVVGISHDHIYGMVGAMQSGGGELVCAWGSEPDKLEKFSKRYPNVKICKTQDEIINDASLKLILSSQVPNERTAIGIRAMKTGKDFLADKPGIINLKDLALVKKTIKETGRIYGIQYSERLDVPSAVYAGELVKQGAIGKVIQTINLAPHKTFHKAGGDAGGSGGRPAWFWDTKFYGGILTDIGSHQVDQFLYYTNSTKAEVVTSQIGNFHNPKHPNFEDFGDLMLKGDQGLGYVRLDWYTPDGLGTWGDGRLFILGTEGYIEVRKYTDVAVAKKGNNLFIVNGRDARYIDCSQGPLPFGRQFIDDVVNRTQTAQNQEMALLAAELSIKAQTKATRIIL